MFFCTEGPVCHVADTFAAPSRPGFRLQRHRTHTSEKGTTYENQLVHQLRKLCPTARETRRIHLSRDPSVRPDLQDRKSTRLNSSHSQISYAVFCLKKKNN